MISKLSSESQTGVLSLDLWFLRKMSFGLGPSSYLFHWKEKDRKIENQMFPEVWASQDFTKCQEWPTKHNSIGHGKSTIYLVFWVYD